MPSIILVRHGPVALKASGLFSYGAFCRFIEAYEQSCLAPDVKPPEELIRLLRPTTHIFASDAPRVADTLCRLGLKADVTDQSFREAPPAPGDSFLQRHQGLRRLLDMAGLTAMSSQN